MYTYMNVRIVFSKKLSLAMAFPVIMPIVY